MTNVIYISEGLLAGMVGALALARAVDDEKLSGSILRDAKAFRLRALKERT